MKKTISLQKLGNLSKKMCFMEWVIKSMWLRTASQDGGHSFALKAYVQCLLQALNAAGACEQFPLLAYRHEHSSEAATGAAA